MDDMDRDMLDKEAVLKMAGYELVCNEGKERTLYWAVKDVAVTYAYRTKAQAVNAAWKRMMENRDG